MQKNIISQAFAKLSFPLVCIIFITSFYLSARNLPAEANMYPIALIIVIILLLLLVLLQELKKLYRKSYETKQYDTFEEWWKEWNKTIITIMGLFIYIFLIETIGFFSSTGLFLLSMFWLLGYRKIIPILLIVSITVIGAYLLFTEVFRIPLPSGIFI